MLGQIDCYLFFALTVTFASLVVHVAEIAGLLLQPPDLNNLAVPWGTVGQGIKLALRYS